ncbi:MAG: restriction endonuclease subunit S [Erysipelotrichaceae bacterium]|jgi:type I restriction enzyme S subunit
MVSLARSLDNVKVEIIEVPKEDLNWTTVSLSDVINKGKRLEASVFDIESKHARETVKNSIHGYKSIDINEDVVECYTRPRFKRIWLDKSEYPIYQPTSILDVYPVNDGYISKLTKTDIESLRVHKGQVLVTCSGTIGNVSYVSDTLDNKIFSHDLLRIKFKKEEDNGFFYTFLKTDIGKSILKSNKYGSVISHIEAEHINEVIIPTPPVIIKQKIHDLIVESYQKRDESNSLIDEATKLLIAELELPPIEKLHEVAFSYSKEINSFSTKLSELNGRLEGSYHVPIVDVIEKHITKKAKVLNLNDGAITKKIILPGRFKRIYVEKGNGKVFLGGKEIGQLDPANKKYLSLTHHSERIKNELILKKNMILVTRSGTVGKISIIPRHWENWIVNEHVLRVEAKEPYHGLIYTWLNSEYGKVLISRQIYGSVVNEITEEQLGEISVPIFEDDNITFKIAKLIDKANDFRYEAYKQEQEAIDIMNREVLGL